MAAQRKAANAMSGMTARACDGCLKRRARWFCAADDAFLCQSCDASVHSANQLASRHERVRFETASSKPSPNSDAPAWHRGFTRKPRTPRHNNKVHPKNHQERLSSINSITMDPLVPELGSSEEGSIEEETEELMLCRVPEFDPFSAMENEDGNNLLLINGFDDIHQDGTCELDGLNEFLPSDMDLAEFVADVESLLVGDEEITCDDIKESSIHAPPHVEVKVKEEGLDSVMNWNVDLPFDSIEEEKVVLSTDVNTSGEISNNIFLRLNYEEVISAWANQGNSPWTTGSTPIYFNPNDGGPDYQGMYSKDGHMMGYGHIRGSDGEREARVSRYREKRRTRLFSKKIRYEVRKLNAEKRPRMKGRFVKRTSFMGTSSSSSTTFPYIANNNNGTHQLPIN